MTILLRRFNDARFKRLSKAASSKALNFIDNRRSLDRLVKLNLNSVSQHNAMNYARCSVAISLSKVNVCFWVNTSLLITDGNVYVIEHMSTRSMISADRR